MGAWPDKSRTCAQEAAVEQGTWQNFVLLKHLTFLHTDTRECRGCLKALWTHYHSVHLGLPLWPWPELQAWTIQVQSSVIRVASSSSSSRRSRRVGGVAAPGTVSWSSTTATTGPARHRLGGVPAPTCSNTGGQGSLAGHRRFHGNTQHQSHAATPSGWLDIKGREWWVSADPRRNSASPTTGVMLVIILTILELATQGPAPPWLLRVCCRHHRWVTAMRARGLGDTLHWWICPISCLMIQLVLVLC